METEKDFSFDPDLIHEIFKLVWRRRAAGTLFLFPFISCQFLQIVFPKHRRIFRPDREKNELSQSVDNEIIGAANTSRRNRPTYANAAALKLSCELLRVFVAEAVHRAAAIAEAEGTTRIEATHLERILPQLLLDF
ncbi:hypothetical protein DM860_010015 [Cuscuta australis]|uniref:Centromere protein X n=1 Tax=Cuscuta australis TaxID=267555 RepID=A0A328DA75_9ASTE|nr:hypothetical protein DM860_010015 [Cuscuta australis]